jgi:ABC-type uncharacterized transport system involved in gliding motility auxiliary subunit
VALMQSLQKWSVPIGGLGLALIIAAILLRILGNARADILLALGALGAVLVGFYVVTRPRDATRQSSNMRVASETINIIVFAAVFILILGAINYIVDRQFSQRIDLTANKQYTLSQQSVQVLQSLQDPVIVTGFFTPATQQQRTEADSLLREYQRNSDKLWVQMIDPDENPALAQKYDNALPGTIVFEEGDRTEKVYEPFDEDGFTNAILKVTQTEQPAVYFTSGHGEYNPADYDTPGVGAIAESLKQVNYKVEPLNMATISGTLPADTRALVIAGPTEKFTPENEEVIRNYLDSGGRVLVLADANSDFGLTSLLADWGVTLENNLILDPGLNYLGNLPIPVFLTFPNSPITEGLRDFGIFLPYARSIKSSAVDGKTITALFTTTDKACAKTDFEAMQAGGQVVCDDADAKGPFVVGVAVEGAGQGGAQDDARSRLIVLGNSEFATNRWMLNQDALGNQQLFNNMVNWLAGQEQLIAIPPRDPAVRPLAVMAENELNLVIWTTIVLVPLAALIIGGLLWWRRR